jgi:hypothetical protein
MLVGLNTKSLGDTARSNSKARMSVKRSALVLIQEKIFRTRMLMDMDMTRRLTPQLKIDNRYKLEVPQ